jgi:hypothetical protein
MRGRRRVVQLVLLITIAGGTTRALKSTAPPPDAALVEVVNETLLAYAQLPPSEQNERAAVMLEAAKLRRAALTRLIRREPEQAIRLSLSPAQRQGLPKAVAALLEQRIHTEGDLVLSVTESLPLGVGQSPPRTSWSATANKRTYEAFVYGARLAHQTKYGTPLHGIAIDAVMAVDESPLYLYDALEKAQLGFLPQQIVATSGGAPIPLPDPDAFLNLRQRLLERILRIGPYPLSKFLPIGDPHPWTTGLKRVLVIRADYSDNEGSLYPDGEIAAVFDETSAFYEENSQRRTSLSPNIIPAVLRLPRTSAAYAALGDDASHRAIRDEAAAAARAYDASAGGAGMFDPETHDRFVVLTPRVLSIDKARGDLGGRGIVFTGRRFTFAVLAHEMGHTYGFAHSNFWFVEYGGDPLGPGTHLEYGDVWDMMGASTLDGTDAEPRRRHFNAFFKWLAGWLPRSMTDVSRSGTFRLYRHDAGDAAGTRAIRIDADATTWYWLDIRRQFPWNHSMLTGVEVRQVTKNPPYSYGVVRLLDMDTRAGTSVDHSLTSFRTFEDTRNGIRVRVTGLGSDARGEYAEIAVER